MVRGVKDSKNVAIEVSKNTEVLKEVGVLTSEKVLSPLANVQNNIQKVLSSGGPALVSEFADLEKVKTAKVLLQEELESLYGVKDVLVNKDNLEAELNAIREAWSVEEQERDQNRDREALEFDYNLKQKRKKEQDLYNEQQLARDKSWRDREELLKNSEQELINLRSTVAGFDEVLKKAEKAIEGKTRGMLTADFETEKRIADAQHASDIKLLNSEKENLQVRISEISAQNASLEKQIQKARQDLLDVSTKALEASSGREAAAALQKVAENATGGNNSKK